ncbi:hypothetical protein M0D21_11630 [Aquimarina sp. D1M17]|uniref:hypothetical protein n=1 Tax=Aquimarina acroporae TaxID=2937283 RepID=UPI0020BDF201|nr:hypothetical protein [Aquimarina acroporae]MCK8522225.1 hypothetical protein [Aquimarina acroporae]
MKKTFYLALSGLLMVASGIVLIISKQIGIPSSKTLVPLFLLSSGICGFIFSKYDKLPKVAIEYHTIQGIGLITYAIIMTLIIDSLSSFLMLTTYFIIMYGLFEILFSFMVLNSNHSINKRILLTRLTAGAINLIGGFILLLSSLSNLDKGIVIAGVLIIIGGVSFVIFSNRIEKKV